MLILSADKWVDKKRIEIVHKDKGMWKTYPVVLKTYKLT